MKEDIKVNAVNLKSADYMESDKLVTLFTYQAGLLSARMKGVKKAQAKLKFASEPFCFGLYRLTGGKGGYIVAGCDYDELFYGLREDLPKYYAACAELEFCLDFAAEGSSNVPLFSLLLSSLNMLCYGSAEGGAALLHFYLNALKHCGYGMDFSRCAGCGASLDGIKPAACLSEGGFFCPSCREGGQNTVPAALYKTFKFINDTSLEKLSTIKLGKQTVLAALSLVGAFIADITGTKPRSLSSYISMEKGAAAGVI